MRLVWLISCLLIAVPVPGNATSMSDDMGLFLAEKGLLDQQERGPSAQGGWAASPGHPSPIQGEHRPSRNGNSELVVAAMGALGVPYKYGGNTFDSGFDCSGFVRAMYHQFMGVSLPRRADQQASATRHIDRSELRPGDLVFFNTLRRAFSHVGIYVGDHKFIHSPKSGAVVRIEDMRVGYWTRRFDGARRVEASGTVRADLPIF